MSGRDAPTDADVAALLAPIAGGAGTNVRPEGDYDRIGEARRDENASLPRGVWVRDIKQADWRLVERLCAEVLAQRSKDLRIACWLCEAWVHIHGFAGLGPGLALIHGLCRDFWADLHPLLEGEDKSARLAAFEWLNERLPVALRQVPVLVDSVQPDLAYDWTDCLAAQRLEAVRGRDKAAAQKAEAAGAVTNEMIEERCSRTGRAALERVVADLRAAMAALAALDETLDDLCGREAPGLSKIRTVCKDIAYFAALALSSRRKTQPSAEASAEPAPAPLATPASPPAAMSRSAAYRQLAQIAAFLRSTEPHSPVPDVIDQVVSWRDMSMVELDSALRETNSSVAILLESIGFLASHAPQPLDREEHS
jgi:type VI secretion system ImpA family protein